MKIRIYTQENFLDIVIKDIINEEDIMGALEEGNSIALKKENGNLFIINTLNIIALEILEKDSPPIK